MSRVWLITGCSQGIGRLLAERVHQLGDSLVATARNVGAIADLAPGDPESVLRVALDVRDAGQIDAAVAGALERFGRIDVVVNNAGYGYFSTQEEAELDGVRAMFETNVFGLVAVTQAVLPHMRRQGSGTVVHVSSVAGRIATPRGGFYQATKWAVEALAEALYHEVASFGIRVVSIEPGRYGTNFSSAAALGPREEDPDSPYAELRARWHESAFANVFVDPQDPREVVDATIAAVAAETPFLRVPVGEDSTSLIARREEMGEAEFAAWMHRAYYGD